MNRRPDPPADAHPVVPPDADTVIAAGRAIIRKEMEGMERLADAIDGALAVALSTIEAQIARNADGIGGRLVVTGIGKSGHIAAKLASTFASTGTPSFYLHAAEAAHGDLGMIGAGDVVLAISRSGDSRELFAILDYCRGRSIPLIAITARSDSPLARGATVTLRLPDVVEVCAINLAPTTSALITLALGHVLAVQLMERRAFAEADFAAFHPGGRLGRGLSTLRSYLQEFGGGAPAVVPDTPIGGVISAIAEGRKGSVVVLEPETKALRGIITEGDLRRAYDPGMFEKRAADIMTTAPVAIGIDSHVRDAVALMTAKRIANLVVLDGDRVVEILDTKDLMQRGYL
ncbi:MAG: SIS domain-containing protein [Bauldia sp.]